MVKKRAHGEHAGKHIVKHEVKKEEIKHAKPIETKKLLTNILKPKIIIPVIVVLVIAAIILFTSIPKNPTSVGDNVEIQYTLQLADGTIIEQGSDTFKVGEISQQITQQFMLASDKIDSEVMKIKEGEEKTFVLEAKDAAGEYNRSNYKTWPRAEEINRTVTVPLLSVFSFYEQNFNKTPNISDIIPINPYWNATITELNNETQEAKLKQNPEEGQILPILLPDGNATIHLTEDKIIITYNPGREIQTAGGVLNVIDITNNDFTIDYNQKYAGEKVTVKIKVLSIEKAKPVSNEIVKIPGAPLVDLFVMSHCPYGVKGQETLIPVMELLGNKANIKIRFVPYAMHGKQELDDNNIEYCIQRDQEDKLIDFLKCFVSSENSAECIKTANIDEEKLNSCVDEIDTQFKITELYNDKSTWLSGAYPLYPVEESLADQYGAQGSETLIINGAKISPSEYRWDPDKIKELICSAFETKPAECSEKLGALSSESTSGDCGA